MFDAQYFMSTFTGNKKLNGLDAMIMESNQKRQYLEKAFREYIKRGLDVNEFQYKIYEDLGFGPNDLLDNDRIELKENVERMVRGIW